MPLIPGTVSLESVGVCITGGVEPALRHMLAVTRRGQQPVNHLFVGPWSCVVDIRFHLVRCWRQSSQVEAGTTNECVLGCLRGRGKFFSVQLG